VLKIRTEEKEDVFLTVALNHTDDLCGASAGELTKAFASGGLSPVESTKAALARAEAVNSALNAFTVIDHEGALRAAAGAEQRWKAGNPLSPVDGVPVTIKDIVLCNGLDVRYGSLTAADVSGEPDAPSVDRLRQAGAVILGLTNTPEFGWKAVTDNRRHGITRNPFDPSKTSGGSSGGAAVAAATGAGALHLGTDGGGSIRIPASFCGIVGLKPSFGRVPAYPASAYGTVAHIGPMARTVEDVALMLNAMGGRDIRDWAQPNIEFEPVAPKPVNWSKVRIGYWQVPCVGTVESETARHVEAVMSDLALAGAAVEEIRLPDQDDLLEIFYRHWYVGAANRLTAVNPTDHAKLDPGFLDAARRGQRYSAVERMQAEVARATYGAKMDALLERYDFLISATVPIPPFEAGANVPSGSDFQSWVEWSSYSFPLNLSQQPACSVPCGFTNSGLPVGLQIVGARLADAKVLSAALTYQYMYPERFLSLGAPWPTPARGAA